MNNKQLSFLTKNGYSIFNSNIIKLDYLKPSFQILYDDIKNEFYFSVYNLAVYEENNIFFLNEYNETINIIKKLNNLK